MVSNCLCVRAAPHRRRRRCAFYPKRERATGQARARCWCGREYRVEQSLLVSSLSRRLVRMSAVRCVCVCHSRRGGLGLARRVRARTSAGGAEKQRTDQRGRRGPGLGGSCGGAGAGQVGGSGVATSRFARSSWFEAGFRSGHLSAVRSPGRVVARQRDRQATLVATERACTRLVYSCRCRFDGSVGRDQDRPARGRAARVPPRCAQALSDLGTR